MSSEFRDTPFRRYCYLRGRMVWTWPGSGIWRRFLKALYQRTAYGRSKYAEGELMSLRSLLRGSVWMWALGVFRREIENSFDPKRSEAWESGRAFGARDENTRLQGELERLLEGRR